MAIVPDEPEEIRIQLARQEFLTEKAILKIPDEVLGDENDNVVNDPEGNASKEFDIHTYHKSEGSVRATYRSNYRISEAWGG